MSETVANLKKRSGLLWQLGQGIVAAMILGLSAWVLHTVENLQVKMAGMEVLVKDRNEIRQENNAQWQALTDLSEKVKKNEIEVIVSKRLFQMLLDQNSIKISVDQNETPSIQESDEGDMGDTATPTDDEEREKAIEKIRDIYNGLPKSTRKDRADAFRDDQIRQFTRDQIQQQRLLEKK